MSLILAFYKYGLNYYSCLEQVMHCIASNKTIKSNNKDNKGNGECRLFVYTGTEEMLIASTNLQRM